MAHRPGAAAVLVTGVFGSGKTSVAEEIADILDGRELHYALLDLDYLTWFDAGGPSRHMGEGAAADQLLLANLSTVVGNYLDAGVDLFILAGAIRDGLELERITAAIHMPVSVVRLTVSLPEIEERLRGNVTTARHRDDLPEAAAWLAASTGAGIEDLSVSNDRPIRQVAAEIVEWLGWR